MSNFEKWDKEFRNQNLFSFNSDQNGLLWLKVKAISRRDQLAQFTSKNNIELKSSTIKEQQIELFELLEKKTNAMSILDKFLCEKNHEWYVELGVDDKALKKDLYKVKSYSWGGDHNNSLDKYLVSHFVKPISNYDSLVSKSEEISSNAWNYVQVSWYNNWTSYLIESLFKRHERVVSAVGEIKSVDFFIDDLPVDLKVTFIPNAFLEDNLKIKLGKKELSWLKAKAKEFNVSYESSDVDESLLKDIILEKLSEIGHSEVLEQLNSKKQEIIKEVQDDSTELLKWLYENQGVTRFGAENRLFIILVDPSDLSNSWKMKRAFTTIEPIVKEYLNNFDVNKSFKTIDFRFGGKDYKAMADVIFVIKGMGKQPENGSK